MAAFTKHKPKNFIARNIIKQGHTTTAKAVKDAEELRLPVIDVEISPSQLKGIDNRRSRTLMVGGGGANSPSERSAE